MRKCVLSEYGECQGRISGEHYISRSVLEYLSNGLSPKIGGLPWIEDGRLITVGINSLTSNIFCVHHNSSLSNLDALGKSLVETIDKTDKAPTQVPDEIEFSGHDFEKWLLKVAVGITFGPSKGCQTLDPHKVALLFSTDWPEGWGLYADQPKQPNIAGRGFEILFRKNPQTQEVMAVSYDICGIVFHLLLGRPDNPSSFGLYRPRGIISKLPDSKTEKRLGLFWRDVQNDVALIRTRVGSTKLSQFDQWEDD